MNRSNKNKEITRCRLRVGSLTDHHGMRQNRLSRKCSKRKTEMRIRLAIIVLGDRLEKLLVSPDQVSTQDLTSLVSTLMKCQYFEERKQKNKRTPAKNSQTGADYPNLIAAESVVDFPSEIEDSPESDDSDTQRMLWRKEMEALWAKHLAKDEYHRHVVRSVGVPVVDVVELARQGYSWNSIRDQIPGLFHDDIRACLSMATECGWLDHSQDE